MTRGPHQPRPLCARCRRPPSVCVCAHLPEVRSRTRVVILQHPRERKVPIGTAQMASRCLVGSTVVVGTDLGEHPKVAAALADPERRPVLLWPGPGAQDLRTAPPRDPITLFVVDGTWAQASKMLKLNPRIAALPRYAIAPAAPSEYRIRREPRAECLSTIEALASALDAIEGDAAPWDAMLRPFRAMVDAQLAHAERSRAARFLSPERRERRAMWTPPLPLRDPARVVVVAPETNAWPADAVDRPPDEIVHWLSVRGDGTGLFETVVRPSHPPAPGVTAYTGLERERILAGISRADLGAACRTLVGEGDVVATWGSYATSLLATEVLAFGRPIVDLRRVAADWHRGTPGSIDRFVANLGDPPQALGLGRAGRRLGQMVRVLQAVTGPRRDARRRIAAP